MSIGIRPYAVVNVANSDTKSGAVECEILESVTPNYPWVFEPNEKMNPYSI